MTAFEPGDTCPDGGTVVFFGSGTKPRHVRSYEMIITEVKSAIDNSGKNIDIKVAGQGGGEFLQRRSLKEGPLWLYKSVKKPVSSWLVSGDEVAEKRGQEGPTRAANRLSSLLKGLINFTKKDPCPYEKIVGVVLTSAGTVAAWTKSLEGIGQPVELSPGDWLKLDISPGDWDGQQG